MIAIVVVSLIAGAVGYSYFSSNGPTNGNGNNGPPPPTSLPLTWAKTFGNPFNLPHHGGQGHVHPDVIYFNNPKDGYPFWMMYTPYPTDPDENPCVVRAMDGKSWTENGIANPVIPHNVGPFNAHHQADPDILYIPEYGKFFVAWTVVPTPQVYIIAFTYSEDGKNWRLDVSWGVNPYPNSPVLLYETYGVIEPTMYYADGMFHMFYSTWQGTGNNAHPIAYLTFQWNNDENKPVNLQKRGVWNPPENQEFYTGMGHPDVFKYGDYFYLMGPRNLKALTGHQALYCYRTSNFGEPWIEYGVLLEPGTTGWDSRLIYRSGMLHDGLGNAVVVEGKLWIYYTGYQASIPRIGLATAVVEGYVGGYINLA